MERVGLAVDYDEKSLRSARRRLAILVPLFIAVVVVYSNYRSWFNVKPGSWDTAIKVVTVLALLALGWAIARDIGRSAGRTFFRRMDPGTAGTVGFLVRLVTVGDHASGGARDRRRERRVAGRDERVHRRDPRSCRPADARQPICREVLLSARPFRVGERVRFQAGAVGGQIEGIVSSLGLLYTTLAQGEDRIMVPNNVVLSAVVVPIREPEPVDVKVKLGRGIRVSQVQAILDDRVKTPTRRSARVGLEQLDGDDVVVRVQATPDAPMTARAWPTRSSMRWRRSLASTPWSGMSPARGSGRRAASTLSHCRGAASTLTDCRGASSTNADPPPRRRIVDDR